MRKPAAMFRDECEGMRSERTGRHQRPKTIKRRPSSRRTHRLAAAR